MLLKFLFLTVFSASVALANVSVVNLVELKNPQQILENSQEVTQLDFSNSASEKQSNIYSIRAEWSKKVLRDDSFRSPPK